MFHVKCTDSDSISNNYNLRSDFEICKKCNSKSYSYKPIIMINFTCKCDQSDILAGSSLRFDRGLWQEYQLDSTHYLLNLHDIETPRYCFLFLQIFNRINYIVTTLAIIHRSYFMDKIHILINTTAPWNREKKCIKISLSWFNKDLFCLNVVSSYLISRYITILNNHILQW